MTRWLKQEIHNHELISMLGWISTHARSYELDSLA